MPEEKGFITPKRRRKCQPEEQKMASFTIGRIFFRILMAG
jgi:hypothetical protein